MEIDVPECIRDLVIKKLKDSGFLKSIEDKLNGEMKKTIDEVIKEKKSGIIESSLILGKNPKEIDSLQSIYRTLEDFEMQATINVLKLETGINPDYSESIPNVFTVTYVQNDSYDDEFISFSSDSNVEIAETPEVKKEVEKKPVQAAEPKFIESKHFVEPSIPITKDEFLSNPIIIKPNDL